MTFSDAVLVVACAVLTLAWLESQFGLRISRVWHRAYDALAESFRHVPPHLRGRVPMECGEGTPSATRLRGGLYPISEERRAQLTEKRAFEDWLDARRINPPTVIEYEALRDVWRREQSAIAKRVIPGYDARTHMVNGVPMGALMANRLPSVREQAGLANARAFQQRYWDAQMAHRPTPAENARRYAAEGGTW